MNVSRRGVIALAIAVCIGVGVVAVWSVAADTRGRQSEVARRGAIVMPFDLDRTTHIFEPRSFGGVQSVVADDPSDREQLSLIREHLQEEAVAFARGDFGDPAAIHGDEMPGLAVLRTRYDAIAVEFEPMHEGARVTYRSNDPVAIQALYDWFKAQVTDHGSHAEGG